MLSSGPAKKVCIYVGEDQQYHGSPTYAAILDFLFYRGVSGATIVKGIAGFGADHHLHTTRILRLTENLPIKIEFIETKETVDGVMPKLRELAGTGLIEVQDTNIAKANTPDGKPGASKPPVLKREGTAKLMRIYVGENDKWHGKPLHEALLQALRANDIAGATVYRGIMGYGANRRIHADKTLSISHDRPMMLSIVDTEEKLRAFLPVLDDMIQQGMVVLSDVDIVKYTHNSQTAERRKESR